MGSPEELCEGGINWRVMTYYELPMGGAAANGEVIGAIGNATAENLEKNPVPMTADIVVTSKISATDPRSADITAKVTAKEAFPANTVLHLIVLETRISWIDDFGLAPSNGQTYMLDVVRKLVSDSTGESLPELAVGESHSFTGSFTASATVSNLKNLRTVVIVQVEDTKEILSVIETAISPLVDPDPIIFTTTINKYAGLGLSFSGRQKISMILPFDNAHITVYTISGRILKTQNCRGKEGQRAAVSLPETDSVLFVKLTSEQGKTVVFKVPFRQ